MFNFSSCYSQLSETLERQKAYLRYFSENALLSSTDDRDQYLENCFSFIRGYILDPLGGGAYFRNQGIFGFNSFANAILSEYLLAVDRVFYTGEFSYLALRMINAIKSSLLCRRSGWFVSELIYTEDDLPFWVSGKQLLFVLEAAELKLLAALIGKKEISPDGHYLIHYSSSLILASQTAGIHYKRAQVLDATIKNKLFNSQSGHYLQGVLTKAPDLVANAQILSTLTRAIMWCRADALVDTARRAFDNLYTFICDANSAQISQEENICVCYALVEFLQLGLSKTCLVKIANVFNRRLLQNDELALLERYRGKISLIMQVFAYFNVSTVAWGTLYMKGLIKKREQANDYQIYKIEKSYLQCNEKQRLLARYNEKIRFFMMA